jgi:hypothetical protein
MADTGEDGRWRRRWIAFFRWLAGLLPRRRPDAPRPLAAEPAPRERLLEAAPDGDWRPPLEPHPLEAIGAHARVTWEIRLRRPVLSLGCPLCGTPLAPPVELLVQHQRFFCSSCGTGFDEARPAGAALR